MKRSALWGCFLFAICAANSPADIVTLKDGGQLVGTVEGTAREIRVKVGDSVQPVAVDLVQSIQFSSAATDFVTVLSPGSLPAPASAPVAPPARPAALPELTLPAGTVIAVRTIDPIDSNTADLNREYAASLQTPLLVDGVTIAPARASAFLKITDLKKSGKIKGSASLSLRLVALVIDGQKVSFETRDYSAKGAAKGRRTATGTGIGAGVGAGLGAITGGALGAGIGAATGGAVGGTIAAITGKSRVQIPSETPLTFTLAQPVPVNTPSQR